MQSILLSLERVHAAGKVCPPSNPFCLHGRFGPLVRPTCTANEGSEPYKIPLVVIQDLVRRQELFLALGHIFMAIGHAGGDFLGS